jgi:hypothetical protein
MAHSPPDSRLFGRPQMTSPARIEDLSKAMGDVNEVVAAIAIASTLDQDEALRRKLRRYADCPDDQPLNLELPVGSAGLQLRPDGSIHPVRGAKTQAAMISTIWSRRTSGSRA